MGRPIPALNLSDTERETFQQWARQPKTVQSLAQRARIILACAEGKSNITIAKRLRVTKQTSVNGAVAFCTSGLIACWMNRDRYTAPIE